ncbi:hypothetical protein STUTZSP0542_39920 [Stutzerimonas marianensis]
MDSTASAGKGGPSPPTSQVGSRLSSRDARGYNEAGAKCRADEASRSSPVSTYNAAKLAQTCTTMSERADSMPPSSTADAPVTLV